jgi:hypothetical protein
VLIANRDELAPVEAQPRIVCFRIELVPRQRASTRDERRQIDAIEACRRHDAEQPEHSRRHVDEADEPIDHGAASLAGGQPDDPRHAQRRVVGEQAMLRLAVIAEPLPVI